MEDSKKIFPTTFENGTNILPRRIISSRMRGYVAPCRRKQPAGEGEEEERLTNQKKQRFWSSYEEMYIVDLWRRYKDEITEFNKPLPVHRKIMVAMRAKDMMVTGQDCRRKLNTLNNRYKTEVQRMRINGTKTDWRLFPLIHCILDPKLKEFDAWHEVKVVKKLLEQLPKPPEPKIATPIPLITLTPSVPSTIRHASQPHRNVQHNNNSKVSLGAAAVPQNSLYTNIKHPTCVSDNLNGQSLAAKRPFTPTQSTGKSNLPFRDITIKKYEQLKLTNEILSQQRDMALKRLRLEEEGLKAFETILLDWAEQTREVLKTIEILSKSKSRQTDTIDSSTEAAATTDTNNGHMEQTSLSVN